MKVYKIQEKDFENKVIKSKIPTVVKFGSDSCHLCVALKPVFKEVAQIYSGQFKFYAVDTSECPDLQETYIENGIPTIYIFFNERPHLIPDPTEPDDDCWFGKNYIIKHLNEFVEGEIL
jgi:thioredoxin 1